MVSYIDIIIVSWNSADQLWECLNSIQKSTFKKVRVIVIDNFSQDDVKPIIEKSSLNAHLIQNKVNKGFAAACNQGIRKSTSDYILFLNPDTILFPDTLKTSLEVMRKHEDVYVLGCKQLDSNGRILPSCTRFPRLRNYIFQISGITKISPRLFKPATIMTDWNHIESRYVDQVMGSFMFLRRSTVEKVGLFDERFFIYYEDLDYAQRVHKAGGRSYYSTDVVIKHEGGGISRKVKDRRLYYSLKSRLRYGFKYFKKRDAIFLSVITILIEPITRIIYCVIKRHISDIKHVMNGYKYLYGDLFRAKLVKD